MAIANVTNALLRTVHHATYLSPLNAPVVLSWIQKQEISVWINTILLRAPTAFNNPITIATIALATFLLTWSIYHYLTMETHPTPPFPFMQLPPELRDMVYEYLLEDPHYPPLPPCTRHSHTSSFLSSLIPGSSSRRPSCTTTGHKKSNWLFLTSKQVYAEYMDMLCKKKTFHFTVSSKNYSSPTPVTLPSTPPTSTSTPSSRPTTPTTPSSSSLSSLPTPPTPKIWTLSPHQIPQIRSATLKLITTSSMLGVTDLNKTSPGPWSLAHRVNQELSTLPPSTKLTITIQAIGDPLWNPLWVWYHAGQSLKGIEAREGGVGIGIKEVRFELDGWSPGENVLVKSESESGGCDEGEKEGEGRWEWRCDKGHCVGVDEGTEMGVRAFCNALYLPCGVCKPELVDDEEDEGDEEE